MSLSLKTVAETSSSVAATRSRKKKVEALRSCLAECSPANLQVLTAWLAGELLQGRIGLGPSILRDVMDEPPAGEPSLSMTAVNRYIEKLAALAGPGSLQHKRELLAELMRAATRQEQGFLMRLFLGDLRQGALEGLMVDAIAAAAGIEATPVRRAVMLSGDLPAVAGVALTDGEQGLACFQLRVGTAVNAMLAQPAATVEDALGRLEFAAFEFKLDGARIQVHKSPDDVRIFTRQLNDVTERLPEIVDAVKNLEPAELILDGEVLALSGDGRPRPFQVTMKRFGRRHDVATMQESVPLTAFFFDCLHASGTDYIDAPAQQRFETMAALLPDEMMIPRIFTADADEAEAFMRSALAAGHEGIMAKSLDAPYEAGNRGAAWLKIKPVHTLDLVVLAAEWGSGRRKGWLSNLHLGARDNDGFVMLGKTFKGLTDELLAWQTDKLLELETGREGHVVHVRPELVVEIAFNDVQKSHQYPGGVALRFARVRRYRDDKNAVQADTLETVRGFAAD